MIARVRRRLACASAGAALALTTAAIPAARAEGSDGIYGRFDGDLELRLHAGAAFAGGGPALAAGFGAVYLSTAGIYAHYTDSLGSKAPDVRRSIAAGVLLQPLFLARFGRNLERGPAHLDLLLDSLAFEVGAFWDALRGGPLRPAPGLEFAIQIGLPILPRASGPFLCLRGALRYRNDVLTGAPSRNIIDRGAVLSLTLGWHQILPAHIVDAGDRPAQ